jgi:23S rRNA pseudouridine1911/1915/1917 synthase
MIHQRTKCVVQKSENGLRLDKYIHHHFPDYSRSFFQKLIQKNYILVNGKEPKAAYKITAGDRISIEFPEAKHTHLIPENIPLHIIYQDNHLVVVNKQAGLVVHPGAGIKNGTLINALLFHVKDLASIGSPLRPGIIHRLDKNTTGLMVIAKDEQSYLSLIKQLSKKLILREYQALVWHQIQQQEGTIETYLNRSKKDRRLFSVAQQGKLAITHYKVEKLYDFLSLLNITLETGRTHQIRSHLNYCHHPVFGDPAYHGRNKQLNQLSKQRDKQFAKELLNLISRQALHAKKLSFVHPLSKKQMFFESSLPDDFQTVLDKLNNP